MPKDYSNYTDYENYIMLTKRELEVLKMKNSGMSNTEISETLGVKYNTVFIYLTRAVQKIDGVFDYEKEKMYKNAGIKRRSGDLEYRKKINKYSREYYHKNIRLKNTRKNIKKNTKENIIKKIKTNIENIIRIVKTINLIKQSRTLPG